VTDTDVDAINAEASALMKRGIGLLQDGTHESVLEALRCFDEALVLRRRVPPGHAPFQGYLLAACLLNRADALVRLGGEAPLGHALLAYEEGIEVLRALPLSDDPRFPRRLAMAHQNRGLALQLRRTAADLAAAAGAFTEAIAVLDHERSAAIPDREYLRGVVWLNLANLEAARNEPGSQDRSRDAATWALAYVASLEDTDPEAAEAGLRARHVLCQSCAIALSQPAAAGETMPEDVHDATDAVDEGLALVRRWEQRGVMRFRPLAFDLFRFGARVYARFQPQFLVEFVEENMDPDQSSSGYVESGEMQWAAQEALSLLPPAS
jgi:hypothetical protein